MSRFYQDIFISVATSGAVLFSSSGNSKWIYVHTTVWFLGFVLRIYMIFWFGKLE